VKCELLGVNLTYYFSLPAYGLVMNNFLAATCGRFLFIKNMSSV
jgi:uncharacterized protein YqgC (DUF456 family)